MQIPVEIAPIRAQPTLYIVATPIGNLGDITLRALATLEQVDAIYCEDTRKTAILLKHFQIETPRHSFRVHALEHDIGQILNRLQRGERIALTSDAGTPGISDPGSHLVRRVRTELPTVAILPLPGASALTAALSISGWQSHPLLYLGFLSPKKGRRQRELNDQSEFSGVIALYESVHRIEALIKEIVEILPEREIFVAREISKYYEDYRLYRPGDDLERFLSELPRKGEFTLLIGRLAQRKKKESCSDTKLPTIE